MEYKYRIGLFRNLSGIDSRGTIRIIMKVLAIAALSPTIYES